MVHLNKFLPQQESFVKSGVSNEGLVLKEAVSLVNPVIEVDLDVSGMNSFGTGSRVGGSVGRSVKVYAKTAHKRSRQCNLRIYLFIY